MESKTVMRMADRFYSLGSIHSAVPLSSVFSKYINPSLFFLHVKTSQGDFFVKRYNFSNISMAKNDVKNAVYLNRNANLNIPTLILNKKGEYITKYGKDIFVISSYIEGNTLRSESEIINNDVEFFNFYIDTNKILKKFSKNTKINFKDRLDFFRNNVTSLRKAIQNSDSILRSRDLSYVDFLVSEVKHFEEEIKKFKTAGQILHGDFFKQNIIRDKKNKLWLLDWEMAGYESVEVDLMKTITYTLFKPDPVIVNLSIPKIVKVFRVLKEYLQTTLDRNSASNIVKAYYFHLITNLNVLMRFYIEKSGERGEMLGEDFNIVSWYRMKMDSLQSKINEII